MPIQTYEDTAYWKVFTGPGVNDFYYREGWAIKNDLPQQFRDFKSGGTPSDLDWPAYKAKSAKFAGWSSLTSETYNEIPYVAPPPYAADLASAKTRKIGEIKEIYKNAYKVHWDHKKIESLSDNVAMPQEYLDYRVAMKAQFLTEKNTVNALGSISAVATHSIATLPTPPTN